MKLNILLRGHIRNSFDDNSFRQLLKDICKNFDCDIYIHTWNVIQTSRSWRRMHDDNREVNEDFLKSNLSDVWGKVKGFIIENEESVVLDGRTDGNIGLTPCPYKGYKSMFYGKLKIAEYVFKHANHDEMAMQTRFDILSNSFSTNPDTIINFLKNPPKTTDRIKFISSEPILGIENIYMAKVDDMYNFIKYIYFNFDDIYTRYNQTRHQEHPVFFERNNFYKGMADDV